jgi:hypothetical protein
MYELPCGCNELRNCSIILVDLKFLPLAHRKKKKNCLVSFVDYVLMRSNDDFRMLVRRTRVRGPMSRDAKRARSSSNEIEEYSSE